MNNHEASPTMTGLKQILLADIKVCQVCVSFDWATLLLFMHVFFNRKRADQLECLVALGRCCNHALVADWAWTYEQYVRDVPGSFEFWMENMMDQSHVAFSHSGVAGNR